MLRPTTDLLGFAIISSNSTIVDLKDSAMAPIWTNGASRLDRTSMVLPVAPSRVQARYLLHVEADMLVSRQRQCVCLDCPR
ncbi:MAG: hypothetical protein ACXW2S_04210 [Telluria sp.]